PGGDDLSGGGSRHAGGRPGCARRPHSGGGWAAQTRLKPTVYADFGALEVQFPPPILSRTSGPNRLMGGAPITGPDQSRFERTLEMSRVPSLSSPFLLGFDEIERVLDRVVKGADGYPPYNIERCDRSNGQPERLRITLAVAG